MQIRSGRAAGWARGVGALAAVTAMLSVGRASAAPPGWEQTVRFAAADSAPTTRFGYGVAIDGGWALARPLSAPNDGSYLTAAYVFALTSAGWVKQAKLPGPGGTDDRIFSHNLALSAGTAVIGSTFGSAFGSSAGHVNVYVRAAGIWSLQQVLTPNDSRADDAFGISVGVSGDTIIVGGQAAGNGAGNAYVFQRTGGAWTQTQKLPGSSTTPSFGACVMISDAFAIVGDPFTTANGVGFGRGGARIFVQSGGSWQLQQTLMAPDGGDFDYLGYVATISGDMAVVSAPFAPAGGAAYVFRRAGSVWSFAQKLTNNTPGDNFGVSLGISNDKIFVGAGGTEQQIGSVYVFSGLPGALTRETLLTSPNSAPGDQFGNELATSGNRILIGSPGEALSAPAEGAAYLFEQPAKVPALAGFAPLLAGALALSAVVTQRRSRASAKVRANGADRGWL